jgi:hypothetical protein
MPGMDMVCGMTVIRDGASATASSSCCRSNDEDHQWVAAKPPSTSPPLFSVEVFSPPLNVWAAQLSLRCLSILTAARGPDPGALSRTTALRI